MALNEDLGIFLSDFGVSCTAGAISAFGILDMPSQIIATDGMVLSTDYMLTARAADFGGLLYGDGITVDGVNYQVREVRRVDDGKFVEIALMKLAPDTPAPGSNPADYSLQLGDLGDVNLTSPTAGEVLKYDGSKWIDGADEAPSYTHTQSIASAVWTITHNLGFKPSVELFNAGSQEIDGDVLHLSDNVVQVTFTIPITGFARLN
mgnify:CR=1 FL=1